VIAFINEKRVIERILDHLGLPTTGPPIAPARFAALAEGPLWQDDVPELPQVNETLLIRPLAVAPK
jgi:hypothetical protein